jgi:hypothetical protein
LVPGETYRFTASNAPKDKAGNALVPTFWDVRAQTVVENTSPAFKESWDHDLDPLASDGAVITSRGAGSKAVHTFTATAGQTVSVFGIRRPDGGFADIYLDGAKQTTATFYAATAVRAKVHQSAALSAGQHSIEIRPTGTHPSASAGSWVSIDNLTVGGSVRQEGALRQWFRQVSAASASGGSFDQTSHVSDADGGPAFSTTLVGTAVRVYASKMPSGGKARIYVDNILKQTVNLNAASTAYGVLVYSAAFPLDVHTVRI